MLRNDFIKWIAYLFSQIFVELVCLIRMAFPLVRHFYPQQLSQPSWALSWELRRTFHSSRKEESMILMTPPQRFTPLPPMLSLPLSPPLPPMEILWNVRNKICFPESSWCLQPAHRAKVHEHHCVTWGFSDKEIHCFASSSGTTVGVLPKKLQWEAVASKAAS